MRPAADREEVSQRETKNGVPFFIYLFKFSTRRIGGRVARNDARLFFILTFSAFMINSCKEERVDPNGWEDPVVESVALIKTVKGKDKGRRVRDAVLRLRRCGSRARR